LERGEVRVLSEIEGAKKLHEFIRDSQGFKISLKRVGEQHVFKHPVQLTGRVSVTRGTEGTRVRDRGQNGYRVRADKNTKSNLGGCGFWIQEAEGLSPWIVEQMA